MKKIAAGIITITAIIMTASVSTALESSTISSTVLIDVYDSTGAEYTGSGFLISNDALILTAAHVVMDYNTGKPAEYINVCIIENEYSIPDCRYAAEVWAYDEDIDLALLSPTYEIDENGETFGEYLTIDDMQAVGLPYADLADYNPYLGDQLKILGFPAASLNPTVTLTQGSVSGFTPFSLFDPEFDEGWLFSIQTDAIINPGNSGGPAFNQEEKVVGVVNSISTEGANGGGNYGYIISNDVVWLWFWELVNEGNLNEEFVQTVFSNDYLEYDYYDYDFNLEQVSDEEIFSDVNGTTKNAEAINYLKQTGIIHGYPDDSFKPFSSLNRAELLKMVMTAIGYTPDIADYNNCFTDVKDEWFAPYVCQAKNEGWVIGFEGNTFKPGNKVTKAEGLKMLVEVFDIPLENTSDAELLYKDTPANDWYAKYVATGSFYGLLEETGDNYYPNKEMLRGQISENIYRTLFAFSPAQ